MALLKIAWRQSLFSIAEVSTRGHLYNRVFFKKIIYLFLGALGLCCCAPAFSSCGERGLLFVAVRELLVVMASRCGARALGAWASAVAARRLSSCGSRA